MIQDDKDNSDKRIDFLNSAISDAQELIRFTDTKTAVAITIIGSIIVGLLTTLETTLKFYCLYNWLFHVLFYLLNILLIVCIWITARIIKPTNNPKANLNLDQTKKFKTKYYIPLNKYMLGYPFYNSDKHKLEEKFIDYSNSTNDLSNNDIIEILILELFKVSFIRNIKNDRFNVLVSLLIITSIVFVLTYVTYIYQTNEIKATLEHCCTK
jgi:hypothetical protein